MNHCVRVFLQNVWFSRLLFEERICRIINNYCHVKTECQAEAPGLDLEALWKTKYIFIIDIQSFTYIYNFQYKYSTKIKFKILKCKNRMTNCGDDNGLNQSYKTLFYTIITIIVNYENKF